jgi:hypothetical protein
MAIVIRVLALGVFNASPAPPLGDSLIILDFDRSRADAFSPFFNCLVLGIADMYFFKSRYRIEILRDLEIETAKINDEVRRAVRF